MYEETKSSIDWKGIFLKVIIAFLIVLIAVKGYTTLKGNNKEVVKTTTETTAESKSSTTFTENIEKLKKAGEEYYSKNTNKLPKEDGNTTMVTLNELIDGGVISTLSDEDGKTCDGESSYVTAIKEGEKTKIKANLVCGSASSYSLVYMGENDTETTNEENTTSAATTYSNTSSANTTNSSSKKTSTCSTSTCSTPSVSVNTNVSQNVSINSGSTSGKTSNSNSTNSGTSNSNTTYSGTNNSAYATTIYYTVSFDSNGGSRQYAFQTVKKNNTASYPGTTNKNGYTFDGWYLNGSEYDFNTPVTSNITLVAHFTKNSSSYNYDYEDEVEDDSYTTYVYSMGWADADKSSIKVSHELKLPTALYKARRVRISNIEYVGPINTTSLVKKYNNYHNSTFIYEPNGWESDNSSKSSLSTVSSAKFAYSRDFKYVTGSMKNGEKGFGFDVTWISTSISEYCSKPFVVQNGDEYATNICNYGIRYKVTWDYEY